MIRTLAWILWAVLPVIGLTLHYGPGQNWMALDEAAGMAATAAGFQLEAEQAQTAAYEAHLKTFEVRRSLFLAGQDTEQPADPEAARELNALRAEEEAAYAVASKAWTRVAKQYLEAASRVDGTPQADRMHWAAARAKVRSGEVFNGIKDLQQLLQMRREDGDADSAVAGAIREELAAAQYIGARLLREEGRPATVWREVSGASRRNFRYLAERHRVDAQGNEQEEVAQAMQRNLEQVLNLEQSDRSQLDGMPLPMQSPRGRRPGDSQPGDGKGKGKGKGKGGQKPGPPADGAGGRIPYGPGW